MNNDRLKFRVWSKKSKRYTGNNASYSIDDSGLLHVHIFGQHYELGNTEYFEVEQCTGLRDINCNLIYAGDRGILTVFGGIGPNGGYVDSDKQVNVRVEWVDECAGFYFVDDNGIYYDMTNSTEIFEIIGNIHEQKD